MPEGYEIIKSPIITEKSTLLRGSINQYSFYVSLAANKIEIKKAIESMFKVKVLKVNVMSVKGKKKRTGRFEGYSPLRKKAIITLRAGDVIKVFEGA
jgi:large subunit ribosomal protein L23